MTASRFGFLLVVCLALSLAADVVVTKTGEVKNDAYSYQVSDPFSARFGSPATIQVTHNPDKQIQVCIVEAPTGDFKIPNNTQFWNISCTYHYITPPPSPPPQPTPTPTPEPPTPTPTHTPEPPTPTPTPEPPTPTPTPTETPTPSPTETPTPVETPTPTHMETPTPTPMDTPTPIETPTPTPSPSSAFSFYFSQADALADGTEDLRNVQYLLAFALYDPKSADETDTVTVAVQATTCPEDKPAWNWKTMMCDPATMIDTTKEVDLTNLEMDTPQFLTFMAPEVLGSFTFNSSDEAQITFYARWAASPTLTDNDGMGAKLVVNDFPRMGTWYVAVVAKTAVASAKVWLQWEQCKNEAHGKGGPGCMTQWNETADYQMMSEPYTKYYYRVIVNSTRALRVSTRTYPNNDISQFPAIYATRGQLPTNTSYEMKNCNFDFCSGANILFLNVTHDGIESFADENQTWFILVETFVPNNTFGVWFDSVCAPACVDENTGTCTTMGPETGICICATSSLAGVDCTIRIGLGPEYIVLIIIAALVVASAVIGFVAWAYMRRKKFQYEHVS